MTTNSVRHPLRVVLLLTLVVAALILLLATAVAAKAPAAHPDDAGGFVTYEVAAGDTLWAIATRYADPGDDIRRAIFDIQHASGLEGSLLVPGQVLRIPVG